MSIVTPRERTAKLHDRVRALKPLLPKNWRATFLARHPEYDNHKALNQLKYVLECRSANEQIIDKLEELFSLQTK